MSSAGLISISPLRDESFLPPSLEQSPGGILIYVAMPEKMVPMQVLESDSIDSVKLRIQSCKGIFTRNQRLVHGGRELAKSNSLVRDYGVRNGNVVHLVVRLSDLLLIHVSTCCGKDFIFHVERGQDIGYVKRQVARRKHEHGEDHEVLLDGKPVEEQRLVDDLPKICKDAVIHLFVRKSAKIRAGPVGKNYELSITTQPKNDTRLLNVERPNVDTESSLCNLILGKFPVRETLLEPVVVNPDIKLPPEIISMINMTLYGMESGKNPIRSTEGTGGAYFMMNETGTKYLSVFKPIDEEPMAINNPRGLPISEDGEGLKKGTRIGEGGIRECAVYLLDHPESGQGYFRRDVRGFSGVPPTVYVKCLHKAFNHPREVHVKTGSLQMYMENEGSCEDMGPSAFPVHEVHKIAVLDIRMANADRHAGNILVSKGEDDQIVLIPIDHGYCLPYTFEDCTFDWLYWPQARQPFTSDTLEYIKSLDAEKDIDLLKFYGWDLPKECARVLRISTMILKKGAEKGLTPFIIGNMICRQTVKKPSIIEEILQEADASVIPGSSEAAFLECVSSIIDRRLDGSP